MEIKLILADIDGTLIERGDIRSIPQGLVQRVQELREKEVLFSLASGRDLQFQENLQRVISGEKPKKDFEGFIYEDGCLRLGNGEDYKFAGLGEQDLASIDRIYRENPNGTFNGMVPLPNTRFLIRRAYVTKEFAGHNPTNDPILQRAYEMASELSRNGTIPKSVRVSRSTDGLDFTDPNAHKGISFRKYLDILEERAKILPNQLLVIGDAGNDKELIEITLEKGGRAAFVGRNPQLTEEFRFLGAYVSKEKGPLGTLEAIKKYMK